MRKIMEQVAGYVIVIGIIATIVAVILYVQRNPKSAFVQKGEYADLIKEGTLYKVIKVNDGDTIVVNIDGHEVTVRLIGIDTPEVVDPRKPVQCYGPEASAKAKEILEGHEVYFEKEKSRGEYDVYGRVLAYAFTKSKSSYNKYMIENGYAREYTFKKEKYKYQKEFREAQTKAQKSRVGLWQKCL